MTSTEDIEKKLEQLHVMIKVASSELEKKNKENTLLKFTKVFLNQEDWNKVLTKEFQHFSPYFEELEPIYSTICYLGMLQRACKPGSNTQQADPDGY